MSFGGTGATFGFGGTGGTVALGGTVAGACTVVAALVAGGAFGAIVIFTAAAVLSV